MPTASSDADLAKIDQAQQALDDFVAGRGVALASRCVASLQDAAPRRGRVARRARRSQSAIRSARTRSAQTAGSCPFFTPDGRAQPPRRAARQGADGAAPPRDAPAHRPGHAARRDDAVRHLLDARRVRGAAHDRQHVLSQALLGLARPLQHHPLERAAHPGRRRRRLAAARGALGLRDRPQRLPLDLPPRRPHHHRACGRLGRRSGDAVAHRGRGQALPVPRVRPPRARRARARPRRPRRDRRGPQAVRVPPRPGIAVGPALSGCRLPSRHQHARCDRGDRRRRAAVRRRPAARRRLRGDADARDERAALCRRGLDDRSRSGRSASRRSTRVASTMRPCWRRPRATGSTSRAACGSPAADPTSRRSIRCFRGSRTTRWCTSPCRTAWSSIRAPRGARATSARARSSSCWRSSTTSRSRRSCASSSRSSTSRVATGRSGSCSSPMPRSGTGTATATSSSGRSRRSATTSRPRTISRSSTSRSRGGGRIDFETTARKDPIAAHVDKLLATVRERFIPDTHLIRYGEGDWNDSLQPADPKMRDWMVSSWTVALLFQQLNRYAEVLRRAGRNDEANGLSELAAAMRADFNRHLIRDGTVAGYALFDPDREEPELLLHPSDTRTGLRYSLLPMTRSIIAGLFTQEQAQHHLRLIREHLLFPDGARLMDRPVAYHGGLERVFRRAESASFFGREIGLMYVHAHLRYGEAMAVLRRGRCAVGGAAGREPDHRHRASRARLAPPAQRLFQQQRRRLSRPLRGERRVAARQGRHGRGRRRLADLLQRPGTLHQRASVPCPRHPAAFRRAHGRAGATAVARARNAGDGHRRPTRPLGALGHLMPGACLRAALVFERNASRLVSRDGTGFHGAPSD